MVGNISQAHKHSTKGILWLLSHVETNKKKLTSKYKVKNQLLTSEGKIEETRMCMVITVRMQIWKTQFWVLFTLKMIWANEKRKSKGLFICRMNFRENIRSYFKIFPVLNFHQFDDNPWQFYSVLNFYILKYRESRYKTRNNPIARWNLLLEKKVEACALEVKIFLKILFCIL